MKKIIVNVMLIFSLVCQFMIKPAVEVSAYIGVVIYKQSFEYVQSIYQDIKEILKESGEDLGIKKEDVDDVSVGSPFVVYDVNRECQLEVVYYPLVSRYNNICAILTTINTSNGWQFTINTEWVEFLNQINYLGEDFIFVKDDENILIESSSKKKLLHGKQIKNSFDKKSFKEKKDEIEFNMKKSIPLDVDKCRKSKNKLYGYTPALTQADGYTVCRLYNAQGQYSAPLCWAAAAATTVNYRKGTNYGARDIALIVEAPRNEGNTVEVINRAICYYGLNYKVRYTSPSYSFIKKSINKKFPIVMTGKAGNTSSALGHAVTITGYGNLGDKRHVVLWDSALKGGKGSSSIVSYSSNGIVFVSGTNSYVSSEYCVERSLSVK